MSEDKSERYYRYDRYEMLQFIPENISTVLEIGCGEGAFGQMLKSDRKLEVWGVELFPEAGKIAAGKIDKVFIGNIEVDNITLPNGFFDCIIFNDVLEHLQYPWTLLDKLRINLKPKGTVVASIPNIRHYKYIKKLLIEKDWEYESQGVMDISHLRFFTEKSISRLFETSGYKMQVIKGINAEKFPWKFALLNKLLFNSLYDMQFIQFASVAIKE
jgi:2-polyprenyl-3-methyl-5-hydroxy-6-metoxy-1,4-benzoquinol methylase